MSFKESGSDILPKIYSRYIAENCIGSSAYRDQLGTKFINSGTYTASVSTPFIALIVNPGTNGTTGVQAIKPTGGKGGQGGTVRIIAGNLIEGTDYPVVVSNLSGGSSTFNSASISSYATYGYTSIYYSLGGAGGAGFTATSNAVSGTDFPTITIEPFGGVSCSGGGEGGAQSNSSSGNGNAAIGRTGGTGTNINSGNALFTSYGSGGGGGRAATNGASSGGTGGPGFVWIVPSSPNLSNLIVNYKSGTISLTNALDNLFGIRTSPNVRANTITNISSANSGTSSLAVKLLFNNISLVDSMVNVGFSKHPFTITSSTANASFYANYYNGIYTLIFTKQGTYTMTTSASLIFDTIVAGNGGTGGATIDPTYYASGGGSGGVRRGVRTYPSESVLTIRANIAATFNTTSYDWSISGDASGVGGYAVATNGANGKSRQSYPWPTVGTSGVGQGNNFPSPTLSNTIGNYIFSPTATVAFNNGIDAPATAPYAYTVSGNFLGGAGCGATIHLNTGFGGFYGKNAHYTSTAIGFGAGGGVTAVTAPAGNPGIIIISFAYP